MKRIEIMNEVPTTPVRKNSSVEEPFSEPPSTPMPMTPPKIVLTPAQAAAEASSKNPLLNPCCSKSETKSLVQKLLDVIIDCIAYIVARILNHPDVRDACSSAILEGMVKMCYDESLHDHLKHVDETLTRHQVSDAAKKGKDTQKIIKAYVGGIFANDDEEKKKNKDV